MKKINLHKDNTQDLPRMESGFVVPEGYFESFGDRLRVRMEAEAATTPSKGIIVYLKPLLGLAASLAIILSVTMHPFKSATVSPIAKIQHVTVTTTEDPSDLVTSTYASLVSDGQFLSALNGMDDYDASKMPKDALVDYLASNCSDFEILNANK